MKGITKDTDTKITTGKKNKIFLKKQRNSGKNKENKIDREIQ